VDIVGVVLSGGPKSSKEGDLDVWAALPPRDWYRLATFIVVALARGCVHTPDIGHKGVFDVEPCKDSFLHDDSLTWPHTQKDLLMALLSQVLEELQDKGALLPQDSVDGLRATIWRTHKGQIRAWTEREVLSVYKHLSNICLSDILDKLENEALIEEIMELMKDEIAQEVCGKHLGLIAQEKTKVYNAALEEARADGLRKARIQGEVEGAQKGQTYKKMVLDRAESQAKIEADALYKSRLKSKRAKLKWRVEEEINAEHTAAIAKRRTALESGLAGMEFDARVDYVRSLAFQLGILDDSGKANPNPSKQAKVDPEPRTIPTAEVAARSWASSTSSMWKCTQILAWPSTSKSVTPPLLRPVPLPSGWG
jgi:hypothetical protein